MYPAKTPELTAILAPALNAARDAAETMESALDTRRFDDHEVACTARDTYESLRDDVLKKLTMTTIKDVFTSADAAIASGDINAVCLLCNTWGVDEHPTVTRLREADDEVRDLEDKLTQARERRAELTNSALRAGVTQYQLAKATDRNESDISLWRRSHLRRKKKLAR